LARKDDAARDAAQIFGAIQLAMSRPAIDATAVTNDPPAHIDRYNRQRKGPAAEIIAELARESGASAVFSRWRGRRIAQWPIKSRRR
jgi:hypothetical protein